MDLDWSREVPDQLDWHWRAHLRPRLDGLTDEEYAWEPVPGCWSVRRRGNRNLLDWAWPEPVPPPVTTISWRIGHPIIGCFEMRTAAHFGGPEVDWNTYDLPMTSAETLRRLDDAYRVWFAGVSALGPEGMARPCGPAEPFPDDPLGLLVLHINLEVIHHGAEIALLRNLWAHRPD